MRYAALSDVGMRRSNNQDSYAVIVADEPRQAQERGHLFLVADGMGAHAAGELASKMAADGIPHAYYKRVDLPPAEALRTAIVEINQQINERGEANIEFRSMGTTCSTLVLLPGEALVGHVGDSRVYRLRKRQLEQLTFDHSLVWELRSAGDFAEADTVHLPKNIITRSLGPHPAVEIDLEGPFPLEPGDVFLLCSDGLTGEVQEDELGVILDCLPPEEAAQVLIDLANLRGGSDNITVLAVRVEAGEAARGRNPHHAGPSGAKPANTVAICCWVLAAMFAAAAVGSGITGYLPVTLFSSLAAVASAGVAIVQQMTKSPATPARTAPVGRYGRGPHTRRQVAPNLKIVADLAQLADQLRDAANDQQSEQHWALDWEPFDQALVQGRTAAELKDFTKAVQHYCRAIRFMMNELRTQADRA
jgi:PPM family protein phosphatase